MFRKIQYFYISITYIQIKNKTSTTHTGEKNHFLSHGKAYGVHTSLKPSKYYLIKAIQIYKNFFYSILVHYLKLTWACIFITAVAK